MQSAEHSRTILIVSYEFPPRAVRSAVRTATIAKYLARNDWRVIVVCCAPDGTVRRDEVWAAQLESHGVEIIRTKPLKRVEVLADGSIVLPSPRIQRMKRWIKQWKMQPDIYVNWQKEAMLTIENVLSTHAVNMLFAAAPPFSDFTLVQEIAEKHNIPFAIDYGDTWLDNPNHSYPTPMHRNRSAKMEESLLRKAAMIFSTTRRTKEDLLRRFRFLTHEEILIVPHGYDVEDFESLQPQSHTGCMITAVQDFHRDVSPKPMFKAVRQYITKHPELRSRFHLHIIGLVRDSHRTLLRKWKLNDVITISPFLDRPRALQELVNADVLWYASNADSHAASAVVGEYLGAMKPLLLTTPDGTTVRTARDLAPVFHTEYDDVKKITAELERVFDAWTRGVLGKANVDRISSCSYATNVKEVSRILGMSMKM